MILDLFCGRGGAALGMIAAGIPADEIVGVDLSPRRLARYPARAVRASALPGELPLSLAPPPALVWASPPCQRWAEGGLGDAHPDHLTPVLDWLRSGSAGTPWWVVENVPRAPLRPCIVLVGSCVGLPRLLRRRHFEVGWQLASLSPSPEDRAGMVPPRDRVTITESLNSRTMRRDRQAAGLPGRLTMAEALAAMGIDDDPAGWRRDEVADAVAPPMAAEVIRQARAAGWPG